MLREWTVGTGAITGTSATVHEHYKDPTPERFNDPLFARASLPLAGGLYMDHLRYGTTGESEISYIHPFLRRNNWRAKNLTVCGNFNLTNVHEVFEEIMTIGQHPRKYSDMYIILEQLGHRLDQEVERLYQKCGAEGLGGMDIMHAIEDQVDLSNVLKHCTPDWDGDFVIYDITGSDESFSVRGPRGTHPTFYYVDGEIIVLASEHPVIQTVMSVQVEDIRESDRGEAILTNKKGE